MKFVNPTDRIVNLHSIGCGEVEPGADVEIPLYLCAPSRTDAGARGKSAVEAVAPQLKPKDAADEKIWKQIPAPPIPQSKVVTIQARPASEAPGVKALREHKEAQALAAAKAKAATPANKPQQAAGAAQTNANAPADKAQG